MAPKKPSNRGLFDFLRNLPRAVPLALAFFLLFGSFTMVERGYAATNYEGYYGGSLYHGDLGGFGYQSSGGGDLVHASVNGGGNLDLGCGSLNIFDYMKTVFNVSDIATQLKAALQTMLAKMLLTYMMSIPIIAAAFDTLNAILDARFSMFQQSCNLDEIRAKAKQTVIADCIKQNGTAATVQCQEQADPMKSFISNSLKSLGANMSMFDKDPIRAMQDQFCDPKYDSSSSKQDPACLFMSFAPRFCLNTSLGGGCTGPTQRPPISMAGVAYGFNRYNGTVMNKGRDIAARVRQAKPGVTLADYQAIAQRADKLAAEAAAKDNGAASSAPGSASLDGNKLAMTNVSYVLSVYGDSGTTSSAKVLEEYQKLHLNGCSPANRGDPLRTYKFIATAADQVLKEQGLSGIDTDVSLADSALKAAGIDANTASKMVEQTYNCLVNGGIQQTRGEVRATAPQLWAAMATTPGNKWELVGRGLGKNQACEGVDHILSFWLKAVDEAKGKWTAADKYTPPAVTAKDSNSPGGESVQGGKEMDTAPVKDHGDAALQYVKDYFQGLKDANNRACYSPVRSRDLLSPDDPQFQNRGVMQIDG